MGNGIEYITSKENSESCPKLIEHD